MKENKTRVFTERELLEGGGQFIRVEDHREKLNRKDAEIATLLALVEQLAAALGGIIKANEEWNGAVSTVVGVPPKWSDEYLNEGRAALAAAAPRRRKA